MNQFRLQEPDVCERELKSGSAEEEKMETFDSHLVLNPWERRSRYLLGEAGLGADCPWHLAELYP